MRNYTIYTDGAYSMNNEVGGIGIVILNEGGEIVQISKKKYLRSTSQRMEIMAVIKALEMIQEKSNVTIISDSNYVVSTMMKNWKRKVNNDLWDELDTQVERHNVIFKWVKGHDGDKYNEIADDLAVEARDS